MPTLTIDGIEITVEPGTTVIEAAKRIGIEIPHFCYHKGLSAPGNCRMCLVEIKERPKLEVSCRAVVQDGMEVYTQSERVLEARRYVMEFLLINHPLDCPECDQAGECVLQDYSFQHGPAHSRFKEKKRVLPYKDLGPGVVLYTTRCIMCTRCIRFCDEIAGTGELRAFEHGNITQIDIYPGKPLTNPLAGNVVDICPVGALVDKDFLHKTRVWNLSRTASVCPKCATGCNIYIDQKDGDIQRIKPRENQAVNSYWICDAGRYGYHDWDGVRRLEKPYQGKNNKTLSWKEAYKAAADGLKAVLEKHGKSAIAGIGSASATNEENFLLSLLIGTVLGGRNIAMYRRDSGADDQVMRSGFTISGDANPNTAGGRLLLGTDAESVKLQKIIDGVNSGAIKAVYFLAQEVKGDLPEELMTALQKVEFLVVQNAAHIGLADFASLILPAVNPYENSGTYINRTGRLQRINPGVFQPGSAEFGWKILAGILKESGYSRHFTTIDAVFAGMADSLDELSGLRFSDIGSGGIELSGFDSGDGKSSPAHAEAVK